MSDLAAFLVAYMIVALCCWAWWWRIVWLIQLRQERGEVVSFGSPEDTKRAQEIAQIPSERRMLQVGFGVLVLMPAVAWPVALVFHFALRVERLVHHRKHHNGSK